MIKVETMCIKKLIVSRETHQVSSGVENNTRFEPVQPRRYASSEQYFNLCLIHTMVFFYG